MDLDKYSGAPADQCQLPAAVYFSTNARVAGFVRMGLYSTDLIQSLIERTMSIVHLCNWVSACATPSFMSSAAMYRQERRATTGDSLSADESPELHVAMWRSYPSTSRHVHGRLDACYTVVRHKRNKIYKKSIHAFKRWSIHAVKIIFHLSCTKPYVKYLHLKIRRKNCWRTSWGIK